MSPTDTLVLFSVMRVDRPQFRNPQFRISGVDPFRHHHADPGRNRRGTDYHYVDCRSLLSKWFYPGSAIKNHVSRSASDDKCVWRPGAGLFR